MASNKRQRQDENRAQKQQVIQRQAVVQNRKRKLTRYATIAGAVALLIGLVWFVSRNDGDDAALPTTTIGPTTVPGPTTSTLVPVATVPALATKPEVVIPEGAAPTALKIRDIITGTGNEVKKGSVVAVQYVGKAYSNKKEFDSSWSRGAVPFSVTVGNGEVIGGWDQGLVGMKVGSRRELIIPPDLAYGAQGRPPDIGPNDTLVFVIDLISADGQGVAQPTTVPSVAAASATTTVVQSATTTASTGATTLTTASSPATSAVAATTTAVTATTLAATTTAAAPTTVAGTTTLG